MKINTIYNEDCIQTMLKMKDGSVDLTLTSPPYDKLKLYKGYKFDFGITARELLRITKEGGVLVWIVADETKNGSESGTSFRQALHFLDIGFKLHDTMIWHKSNTFNFGSNLCYRNSFEYMFVLSKGKIKTVNLIKDIKTKSAGKILKGARKNPDGSRDSVPDFIAAQSKKRDNVWNINVGGNNYGHPAVFPEKLASDHICSWSNEGDLIYDPFIGSGTTAVSAIKNNRNFLGSEISTDYFCLAKKRIEGVQS